MAELNVNVRANVNGRVKC